MKLNEAGQMIQEEAVAISRRGAVKAAVAMGAAVVASPLLQACTTKGVEAIFTYLGDLSNLINDYRKDNGLSEIPLSSSLLVVALKHVIDLNTYHYDKTCGGNSNDIKDWDIHAWSKNGAWSGKNGEGTWKGCCFDPAGGSINNSCMWDKPKEITGYPDNGFEIAHWESGVATAKSALNSWKGSKGHNDVILNKDVWAGYTWKAIGAAYSGNYACAWFGATAD